MNTDALFLFLILLLGLVLCSFLGGNCGYEGFDIKYTTDASGGTVTVDGSNNIAQTIGNMYRNAYDNYNHYSGTSSSTQLQSGAVYTDGSGNNITVVLNVDGTVNLKFTQNNNVNPVVLVPQTGSPNVYVTSGSYSNVSATVVSTSNGVGIRVTMPNGQTKNFTSTTSTPITSSQYYGSTGSSVQTGGYSTAYYDGAYGASAGAATGPQGNTAYYAQGPQGNTVAGTTSSGSSSNSDYYNSLPPGIPRSQIPAGQEDLYILKSQVVPPVCPVCPTITSSSNDPDKEAKCPPCPACARCPEPSFECKKVPNYSAIDNQYLPQPVISDFSTFGM
jgi:hypothetical protein